MSVTLSPSLRLKRHHCHLKFFEWKKINGILACVLSDIPGCRLFLPFLELIDTECSTGFFSLSSLALKKQ